MAAAAPSPLASSVEKTNGAKLSTLLVDGGTTVLRNVFDGFHPPANLAANLNANYLTLNNLFKKKVLHKPQWDLLFPPGGSPPDSNTFDITLLFLLLTNICGLSPPLSGWHKPPPLSYTSREANLARIKLYRNELYGHVTSTGIKTATFNIKWKEISAVLVALGLNPAEIAKLKAAPCGGDYINVVIDWVKSDEEIKSQLAEVRKTQHEAWQRQEEDHTILQDTHKQVEDIRQANQDTHQVVKEMWRTQQEVHQKQEADWVKSDEEIKSQLAEVRKTQHEAWQRQEEDHTILQDAHKQVEDIRQAIYQDTQQVVEEIWTAQQEVVRTQQENLKTLQQVNKKVEKMKERSNKDKDDEILRKLAEVNSQKVIEDHSEKYQEGTRMFFFESVKKWLDDRSSPNRVMVISGNAGMGKSVIAAVICKRMQEAGRLSGSHFCQHDKARYRNSKVMLQSLAFQLSRSLPEYKDALVKTLSRNLGVELNNMDVKDLFDLLFDELLSKLKDPGRNILLVVDGLDESEYQGRNELLDVISKHFIKLPRWIRFLVTTRPEINIADSLQSFRPLQLEPNNEENLLDLKLLFEKQLNDVIPKDEKEVIINELVKKSEGLILYAYLLVHFIKENVSLLTAEKLDSTLPSGISFVYQTYFQRLERELCKELKIREEQFLMFLSALTAAREPLLLDFVSKIMLSGTSSSADRRKVKRAIACISTLLPVRDDRIHFFHKSVKDWLTDTSSHDFTVDATEGHGTLSKLCAHELDDVKQKRADSAKFSDTAKYALQHGVQHMLYLEEDDKACEVVMKYVVDLELVYAKLCVSNTIVAEDILWIQKQEIFKELSEDTKCMFNSLMFLLRKYYNTFRSHPHIFFQTVLNEGVTTLSPLASNLLQTKYSEMAYLEFLHKQTQQGACIARFQCSSKVVCFDVSPELDYMVCECQDRTIQLWSLHTGKQVWVRPGKNCCGDSSTFRRSPSSPVFSLYRSVVFHPEEDIVLPGVLSHAYTFDGDQKALFPQSLCRFTVCSISGNKTTMLTDCPDDAKCIIMWNLKNGREITRTTRNDDVLSFAWSPDGWLLAISHSTGLICFVDVRDGFRTVAEHSLGNNKVCGMINFSSDCRTLFCFRVTARDFPKFYRLNVNIAEHPSITLDDSIGLPSSGLESPSVAGFLLGDPPLSLDLAFDFVLGTLTVLRMYPYRTFLDMLDIIELRRTVRAHEGIPPFLSPSLAAMEVIPREDVGIQRMIAFSWETVYVRRHRMLDWDSDCEEPVNQIGLYSYLWCAGHMKEGVLLLTKDYCALAAISLQKYCFEMWNFEMSKWCLLFQHEIIEQVVLISEEEVAFSIQNIDYCIFLNTTTSSIPYDHRLITCNSKEKEITCSSGSLQLHGKTTCWKTDLPLPTRPATFSLSERFVVICAETPDGGRGMHVLDASSGTILHILCKNSCFLDCQFVSDEECVILSVDASRGYRLGLFNVESGELLGIIDLERRVSHLAVCPRKRLLAVAPDNSQLAVELIQVHLPRDKKNRKSKRMPANTPQMEKSSCRKYCF